MCQIFYKPPKCKFYLRKPNGYKPTSVYCVIRANSKKYVIPTLLKVYPDHWSKRLQKAIISPMFTKQDNINNGILNEKINDLRKNFIKFSAIVYKRGDCGTILDTMIRKYFYCMDNNKKASELIEDAFSYRYPTPASGTPSDKQSTYQENKTLKTRFVKYLENETENTPDVFDQYIIESFKDSLIKEQQTGKKTSNVRINRLCDLAVRLINVLHERKEFKEYKIPIATYTKLKDLRTNEEKGRFPLTSEEVQAIHNLDFTPTFGSDDSFKISLEDIAPKKDGQKVNNKYRRHITLQQLKEYRDIFLLQINCGQRVSDLSTLIQGNYEKKTDNTPGKPTDFYVIRTKKSQGHNEAYIEVDQTTSSFFKKYESGHSVIIDKLDSSESLYNLAIKKICQTAGLNRIIESRDSMNVLHKEPVYKVITSHCARHTFITNKIKAGFSPDVLCWMTGHKDDTMIKQVYTHLTADDKTKKISLELSKVAPKSAYTVNPAIATQYVESGTNTQEVIPKFLDFINSELEKMLPLIDVCEKVHQYSLNNGITLENTDTLFTEYQDTIVEKFPANKRNILKVLQLEQAVQMNNKLTGSTSFDRKAASKIISDLNKKK